MSINGDWIALAFTFLFLFFSGYIVLVNHRLICNFLNGYRCCVKRTKMPRKYLCHSYNIISGGLFWPHKPWDKMICRYLKVGKNYIKYINNYSYKGGKCYIGQKFQTLKWWRIHNKNFNSIFYCWERTFPCTYNFHKYRDGNFK